MKHFHFILLNLILPLSCLAQDTKTKINKVKTDTVSTGSGLKYIILKKGSGQVTKAGHEVLIYETASYLSGKVLYTNEGSTRPIKVKLGAHQATDGEDEGLTGMQVGEVRRLIIPNYLCKRSGYPPNVSPDSAITVKVILDKILN